MNRQPAFQLGLFDRGAAGFDATFARGRRVDLDATSWIEHYPAWLSRNETLLDDLATRATWEQRQRWMYTRTVDEPRLTAEHPVLADAPFTMLQAIGAALSQQFGVTYDRVWMNLYRDHRDATGWHADRPAMYALEASVPVLSLGATRRFVVRPRDGGRSTTWTVDGGDLIVMRGRCQRDHVHCVPREARSCAMRISVNFASASQRGVEAAAPTAP